MERKEFIQSAVIAMAGKVIGANGITDDGDWEHVINEAEELADKLEAHGYGFSQ